MLKIGLTGGIGAGKSLVSETFSSLGVPIIDTDVISRELLAPGSDSLRQLANKLGQSILSSDGSLRRKHLQERLFEDSKTQDIVESILHPAIKAVMLQDIAELQAVYCILVIPLLIEKNWQELVDRILLIDAEESIRIERVLKRDPLSRGQILKILRCQAKPAERRRHADDIITNEQDSNTVIEQVNSLHKKYLRMAKSG
ncbi:MAG: dephospho-CoA kinase [Thiohalomonadales bacterium]